MWRNRWKYIRCSVRHVVAKQFERYEFPGTVVFEEKTEDCDVLLDELKCGLEEETHMVQSAFGGMYRCSIHDVDGKLIKGVGFVVTYLGLAVKEEAKKKRQRGEVSDPPATTTTNDDDEQPNQRPVIPGYRVLKSRFNTGKCATCKGSIDKGEYIASRGAKGSKSKWSHVKCCV